MEDSLEVYFCDLCNASVPQPDLETGKAARVRGRVLGACCLAELRGQSGAAASGSAVAKSPTSPSGAGAARGTSGVGVAGMGVVLLAAVAGAALFLDWRLADEVGRLQHHMGSLEATLIQQEGRLQSVADGVGGAATAARSDLTAVRTEIREVGGAVTQGEARLRAAFEGAEERTAVLSRSVAELRENQNQQLSGIQRLQRDLRGLGEDVAALAALPRPAPAELNGAVLESSVPAATPPFEAAGAGLPAELAHHVAKLGDEDPGTRFEAVDKLIQSLDPAVLEHLTRMTRDADPFVRRLTVEGLADFRSAASVDALLTALADPEGIVRHAAYSSLRKLTGQNIQFDPDGRKEDRRSGQRRWQDWWGKNRDSF